MPSRHIVLSMPASPATTAGGRPAAGPRPGAAAAPPPGEIAAPGAVAGLRWRPLGPPLPARPVPRRSSRLARAIRDLERRINILLGNYVHPWIPGLRRVYGWQLRRGLTVATAEAPVRDLPASFEGVSVLLISDIHTGPFLAPADLAEVFCRLQALAPDLILLAGDLTTARPEEFAPAAGAFASLRAPLGVFAVLGNHDHYSGRPQELRRALEAAGIPVLHNRAVRLERGGRHLRLAGIDDLHWGRPDLDAVLDGDRTPTVLLSHNPDVLFDAAARGVSLVLAGHTHGGQVRLPGLPIVVKMSRFALDDGRYAANGAEVIVSRGLGVTGLPLRLRCAPEALLVRLRRR